MAAQQTYIEVNGLTIPIKIYQERRNDVRASIGRRHFILRMPDHVVQQQQNKYLAWFKDWIADVLQNHPSIRDKFQLKTYETGTVLQVGERQYLLEVTYQDRKTHTAKLKQGIIYLKLGNQVPKVILINSIKRLLSRIIAQDFLPEIEQRVHQLNVLHFQVPIKKVVLKYNQSNWGSCSTKGNINLSTRLLFAPPRVIDYVIIHELAHLVEMNHSNRFWQVVAKAMPDYKQQENWLKKESGGCDF